MLRKGFWLLLIAGAVGVPYLSSEWPKLKAGLTGQSSSGAGATSSSSAKIPAAALPSGSAPNSTAFVPTDPKRDETPLVDMSEAFRFEVTPDWVLAHWPRVTAGLPDEKYQGLRVPLITGMRADDLAGSLTYYFTPSQKCAKIQFSGTTGDPRRMTALMMERFGFKQFISEQPGVQLFQIRWNGDAHSELLIRPASVVRAAAENSRFEVKLVVTDPTAR
jgi:hypothetical protein